MQRVRQVLAITIAGALVWTLAVAPGWSEVVRVAASPLLERRSPPPVANAYEEALERVRRETPRDATIYVATTDFYEFYEAARRLSPRRVLAPPDVTSAAVA